MEMLGILRTCDRMKLTFKGQCSFIIYGDRLSARLSVKLYVDTMERILSDQWRDRRISINNI